MTANDWRPIPGYEGLYEITSDGTIRSKRQSSMRLTPQQSGHLRVTFSRDNVSRSYLVHRLVLLTFVGPCPPDKDQCCHRDGNPTNNAVANLYWGTTSENAFDRVRHGVHNMARKTHCVNGHEFTPENTGYSRRQRYCRQCCNASAAASRVRKAAAHVYVRGPRATHCIAGLHLWSEQVPVIAKSGKRECRPCREDWHRYNNGNAARDQRVRDRRARSV